MTVEKRPRINAELVAEIEQVRGDVPFERWINRALVEVLAKHTRPDIGRLARAAAEASDLTDEERAAVSAKISANAESGRRPREGLTHAEEQALDVPGTYMLNLSGDDLIAFQRIYWADGR